MEKLDKLHEFVRKLNDIEYLIGILDWEVKMNVPNDATSEINTLIDKYVIRDFKIKTSRKYEKLLLDVINSDDFKKLGDVEKHHIEKLYKDYLKNKNVPLNFYKKYLKISMDAGNAFQDAKNQNDAKIVLPKLEKMVDATKEMIRFRNSKRSVYEELLNDFEEGTSIKEVDRLFSEIKKELIPFIKKYKSKSENLNYSFGSEQLKQSAEYLLTKIGFDFNKGDVNLYQNAFTARLGFNDVRITFNDSNNPCTYASTVIHEGGHALVESNISKENLKYAGISLRSLTALHESQSRFFENIIGKNKYFWQNNYNEYKKIMKLDMDMEKFYSELTKICPSAIRLESDEVSYCMHIIIRYEIEKDLFSGKITVYDIPRIWKEKYKEYLDVDVEDDADNFLQDVHWSQGSFGYFPAYLLGTIYSACILEALEKELGPLEELLKNNEIDTIVEYLKNNIYKYGGAYSSDELFKKMGIDKVSAKPLINYFKNKYKS